MPVAPQGMKQVYLNDGTSTIANESALTISLMKYANDHKIEDLQNLCVLGFTNNFHGFSIGSLSCSDPDTNIQNAPTYDWPLAQFPQLKYPYADYEHENR
jgi:adenosylmethionine-8-amino-7-oxononanoate aminotransferase